MITWAENIAYLSGFGALEIVCDNDLETLFHDLKKRAN